MHRATTSGYTHRGRCTAAPIGADALERLTPDRDGLTLDGQDLQPLKRTLAKVAPAASRTTGDRERQLGAAPTFATRLQPLLPAGTEPLVAFRIGVADHAGRTPRGPVTAVVRP